MHYRYLALISLILATVVFVSGCGGGGGGILTTYTVSGTVVDSNGNSLDGVTLVFTGDATGTTTTKLDGSWEMAGLKGTVTVSPSKQGYTFVPANLEVSGGNDAINFIGSADAESRGTLQVSFIGSTSTFKSRVALADLTEFDRSIYATPFNTNSQGERVGSFTPEHVICNIFDLGIAHPNYRLPLSLSFGVNTGPHQGFGLLPTFDFVYSRDILHADYMIERDRYDFDVVELMFGAAAMGDSSWETFPMLSEVHVDLGENYRDIVFPNEESDKKQGTVHVFQLKNLIPLPGEASMVRIAFDQNVDRPYIVNPDGSYVRDFNPYFWDSNTRMGINAYVIYLPGLNLDFSQGSKHLVFEWSFGDLIEVYDNGTPNDFADDLATLRLDNPFPITLRVEPYDELTPIVGDGINPPEVSEPDIRFFDLVDRQVFVRWLNPSIDDFKQVHVIKKEGSAPTSIDDGEKVYVGTFPMYEDNSIELSKEYFYRIVVEDQEGLFSEGQVVSIKADPPVFTELRIHPESASLSVGDQIRLEARGVTETGETRYVVPTWSVNGEIGTLNYTEARSVTFSATTAGTGAVTATWGEISATVHIEVTN